MPWDESDTPALPGWLKALPGFCEIATLRELSKLDATLDLVLEPGDYKRASDLWRKQTEAAGKDNPRVLANAANFFLQHDRALAEALLKRAIELDPKSAGWAGTTSSTVAN